MQRFLKWSLGLGLPMLLGFSAWQGWFWWHWVSSPPLASSAAVKEVEIKIPPGTATQQIGRKLEAAGLIRSYYAWELWTHWLHFQDPKGEFQAGTYQLSPTESLSAITTTIQQGQVVERSFMIPEGWSLRQMSAYFEAQGFFPAKDFLAAASQINRSQYPWLPTGLPNLEGFLYPDTYKLSSNRATPQAVVQQMLHQFEQKALPLYRQGQSQTQLNLLQWVTLASIVEKEAVVPQERPRIAGVFVSRLRHGIRLGSDPTVEYALGIRQTAAHPLTLAQVKTPSPYNTYLNPGLPPTPIASPGLSSLKAALYPEHTPYLYFVARYDGTHIFSRTLSAHQAAQASIRHKREQREGRSEVSSDRNFVREGK
ncbi:MAG: endolytic transglycosylase MltG [Chroococcidiopsidaceae cyanobacterium CP_BM_RX_35]|nr:endolytic transglycosylase MltG [Chroococcidiopsidaceae cyanobacterium CP_BM_RX_35]